MTNDAQGRPGFGLPPKHLDALLGRRLLRAVHGKTPVRWEDLER
jgi:sialic acid synthase SpsE